MDQASRTGRRNRVGGLLWHRDFRLLWFGETISEVGNAMAVVAVPLLAVTVLHASTFMVSALVAAAWLSWLLIGLPAGAWVDRLPCRAVMVICDAISAALYASVPAAACLGVLTIGPLLAVALLGGVASVFFNTAYQVYLPSLVAPEDLVEGNAKLAGSASAARFGGPGLAGLTPRRWALRRHCSSTRPAAWYQRPNPPFRHDVCTHLGDGRLTGPLTIHRVSSARKAVLGRANPAPVRTAGRY